MKLFKDDVKFGSLKKSHKNGGAVFELLDINKKTVAYAEKKQFPLGSVVEIYDMFGGMMGTIQHTVQNPTSNPIQKYVIFDGFGKVLAESKQQDQIQKNLALFNR